MKRVSDLELRINRNYDFLDIIQDLTGKRYHTSVIHCPFHDDARKSAKIYHDKEGDKIVCFAESKQFSVCDFLRLHHQNLSVYDPGSTVEVSEKDIYKKWNISPLFDFKTGKITIEEFCKRVFNLRKENANETRNIGS